MAQQIRRAWNPSLHLPVIALVAYAMWLLLAPQSAAQELLGSLGVLAARAGAAFALLSASRRLQAQRIWGYLGIGAALWATASAINLGGAPHERSAAWLAFCL